MERFVIIVNGWKPLTIITKRSILNVGTVLDPPMFPVFPNSDLTESMEKYLTLYFAMS